MRDPVREAWLDTNVIVRLVAGDGTAEMRAGARRLLASAADGALVLRLHPLVVGECLHVLSGLYKGMRAETAQTLRLVLHRPGVLCVERPQLLRALSLWEQRTGLHFVDCYLIASAEAAGHAVASFDGGIKRTGLVPVIDAASA